MTSSHTSVALLATVLLGIAAAADASAAAAAADDEPLVLETDFFGKGRRSHAGSGIDNGDAQPKPIEVTSGTAYCSVDADNCVTDGDGAHGPNEACTVTIGAVGGTLDATEFLTQAGSDQVTIGGQAYGGDRGPSNVVVAAGSTFTWRSDGSVQNEGWVICFTPHASEGDLTCDSDPVAGDTTDAVHVVGSSSGEHFYRLAVTAPRVYSFSTCVNSSYDTQLRLYAGDHLDASSTQVDANDDACGAQSRITQLLLPGEYTVIVEGWSDNEGAYTLTTSCESAPVPEAELTCDSGPVTGDTTDAVHTVGSTSGEHFYRLTITAPREYTFSTCTGSSYDTQLLLYSGNHFFANGTQVDANDDACGSQSRITRLLMPGEYTVIVEGYDDSEGAYTLTTSCGPALVPEAELTCDSDPVTGDTTGAVHLVGSSSGEHFYRLTVASPREYTFSTCDGSSYDTQLRLYTGSHLDASSTQVDANDDACGTQSRITRLLMPGEYTVIVEGWSSREGAYTLTTSCGLPAPVSSGDLTCDSTFTDDTTGAMHVVGSSSGEHFYRLTVTAPTEYTFSTCDGSSYDTRLWLYSGRHFHRHTRVLAESDDACGSQSRITRLLLPGNYTVVVEGWSTREGAYALTTSCGPALVPEAELTCDSDPVTGDTTGAVDMVGTYSGEHFYSLTVTAPMEYTFSTCDGSSHDTILRLYTGSHLDASSTQVAQNNDACGTRSSITRLLMPGEYTVLVEGWTSREGAYTLTTRCVPPSSAPTPAPTTLLGAPCLAHTECQASATSEALYCARQAPTPPPSPPPTPPFSAPPLTCGSSFTGDTTGAVHAVGDDSGEHFYRLTVTAPREYTFSTCAGSSYDTTLRVYSGNDHLVANITQVDANDDACGLHSYIVRLLMPGEYTVIVEGNSDSEGTYTLTTSCGPAVVPEAELTCDSDPVTGNTTGAVHVVGSSSGEHFYRLTVTAPRLVTFSTCDGSSYDTQLLLYSGNHLDASSTQVDYNDDACGAQSRITRLLMPGEYTVIVEGWRDREGAYALTTSCGPAVVPEAELTCDSAPVTGDTTGAVHAVGSSSGEHFYRLTVTAPREYTFSTCDGSSYNTHLRLYTGSHLDASSTLVTQNDNACGSRSRITRLLMPGEYTVLVEGYSDSEGAYTLTTSCGPAVVPHVPEAELTCDSDPVTGDTTNAANSVGSSSGEHFYRLTVTAPREYTFSTCDGSSYDTQLRVYTGNHLDARSTQVVANDDACGTQSRITRLLMPGVYTVIVEGWSDSEGAYTLTTSCGPAVVPPVPEAELTCDSAPVTGDTTGAVHNVGSSSGEHFYRFTVTAPRVITFSTCDGSSYDTLLRLYTGSHLDASSTLMEVNDDACGSQSRITQRLIPGVYTVVVEGWSSREGAYTLTTSCGPPAWPTVADAELTCDSGPVTGDTTGAANTVGSSSGEHVYPLTVTAPRDVTFSTCVNSSYDTRLRLYTGNHLDASSTQVTQNDDACDVQSRITQLLLPGNYTVIVEGYSDSEGTYTLTTSCGPAHLPEAELTCDSGPVTGDTTGADNLIGEGSGEHFYSLTVASPREYTFSTCDASGHDTILRIYTGNHLDSSSTQVAANDDACGFQSRITMLLTPGEYTVVVEGWSTNEGAYTLSTSCAPLPTLPPLPNPFACAVCTEPGSCSESDAIDGVCPDVCPAAITTTPTLAPPSVDASSDSDNNAMSSTMLIAVIAAAVIVVCVVLVCCVFCVCLKRRGDGDKADEAAGRNFDNPAYEAGGNSSTTDGFGFAAEGAEGNSGYMDIPADGDGDGYLDVAAAQ